MKKVNWKWDYGVYVPFCPYCDELAYEKERCCFCGKEYEWVEGKYKPTKVAVGNYTVIQSTNNHISIYKNGDTISHISCNKKLTEQELKDMIPECEKLTAELFKAGDTK